MIRLTCMGGMPVLVSINDVTKVRALEGGGCEVLLRGCCEPFNVKEDFKDLNAVLEARRGPFSDAFNYVGQTKID